MQRLDKVMERLRRRSEGGVRLERGAASREARSGAGGSAGGAGMASMASTHRVPADLAGLQCPYTWGGPRMEPTKIDYNLDSMVLAGTGWTLVADKLAVAVGMLHAGRVAEGRALLVDLYSLLLPIPCFDSGSDVVRDHREALRHLLDSSWIGMEFSQRDWDRDDAFVDVQEALVLTAFLKSITPFDRLPAQQQAAVLATKAIITGDVGPLRKSVELSPAEGQWPFHLGVLLQRARTNGVVGMKFLNGRPAAEELSALRQAHLMARAPEAGLKLAKSLADMGREGQLEAKRLVEEALDKHPDNVAVLYQAAYVLLDLHVGSESRLRARAEALYRRCVALLAGRRPCASLHMDLCLLLCEQGRREEARRERAEALRVNRAAICQGGEPPKLEVLEMCRAMKTIFK